MESFFGLFFNTACITDLTCQFGCRQRCQLWSASDVLLRQHLFCRWRTSGSTGSGSRWKVDIATVVFLNLQYMEIWHCIDIVGIDITCHQSWWYGSWKGTSGCISEGTGAPDWKVILSTLQGCRVADGLCNRDKDLASFATKRMCVCAWVNLICFDVIKHHIVLIISFTAVFPSQGYFCSCQGVHGKIVK